MFLRVYQTSPPITPTAKTPALAYKSVFVGTAVLLDSSATNTAVEDKPGCWEEEMGVIEEE